MTQLEIDCPERYQIVVKFPFNIDIWYPESLEPLIGDPVKSKLSLFELDSTVLLLEFFNLNTSIKDLNKIIFKCHQIIHMYCVLYCCKKKWRATKVTLSSSNNIFPVNHQHLAIKEVVLTKGTQEVDS